MRWVENGGIRWLEADGGGRTIARELNTSHHDVRVTTGQFAERPAVRGAVEAFVRRLDDVRAEAGEVVRLLDFKRARRLLERHGGEA